jgi:anthranilate synthase component 1
MFLSIRSRNKWGIAFGSKQSVGQEVPNLAHALKFKKIPFAPSPLEIFSQLHKRHETVYLLESLEGPQKLAQYSFIGFNPRLTITVKDGVAVIRDERTSAEDKQRVTDPLSAIQQVVSHKVLPNRILRFVGGAVGYISYDVVRYWEKIPHETHDDTGFPDIQMGVFDDGIVFDHKHKTACYYFFGEDQSEEILHLTKSSVDSEALWFDQPKVNVSQENFEKSVEKAKEFVRQGDIFQVVLSKRYDFRVQGDLIGFYRALRDINPSPYMYFFKAGDRQIVGSSPEMLVRVENRAVETFPIAGTRPIAKTPAENSRLAQDLLADPKERAEHVMLVDLARNDVGKVAAYGSVHVPEFMQVHSYSHVQHIVSRVAGNLREGCDSYDAFKAVFPAGTVSGAPKPRAMEIIEELEPARRGPYAGAVGYFSYNGNADFAITIRTLFADKDKAHIQAGAGIVADSVPEQEWVETENKAQALIKALEMAGGRKR